MKITVRETEPEKQNRIEALRAASRVVAGILAGEKKIVGHDDDASLSGSVLSLAEQFARWLEDGER